VRGFLAAVEQAVEAVNTDKARWQDLLTEQGLVPAPILGSYAVPDFPAASVPSVSQFADVLDWTQQEGLIEVDVSYDSSVDDSFLP
jgi:NitT/TauT family transport system substrate-binding protein